MKLFLRGSFLFLEAPIYFCQKIPHLYVFCIWIFCYTNVNFVSLGRQMQRCLLSDFYLKELKVMFPLQELLQLEDRLGSVNRGAVQTTIERFTFPHKYKKVKWSTFLLACWATDLFDVRNKSSYMWKTGLEKGQRWVERIKEWRWGWKEVHDSRSSSKVKLISVNRLVRQVCSVHNSRQGMSHPAVCRYVRGMNLKNRLHWIWPKYSGKSVRSFGTLWVRRSNWVFSIWCLFFFFWEAW